VGKPSSGSYGPKTARFGSPTFVQIVKQMEAFDVLVLKIIANNYTPGLRSTSPDVVIIILQQEQGGGDIRNDVGVSFDALAKLDCISADATGANLTPFGTLLMRAVSG
jgi:hypothetical protein